MREPHVRAEDLNQAGRARASGQHEMSLRALDVIVVQRDPAEQQVAGMSVVAALSFGLAHVAHQHPLGVGASMIDATELERECACDVTQLGRKFRVDDVVAQQLFHLVEVALTLCPVAGIVIAALHVLAITQWREGTQAELHRPPVPPEGSPALVTREQLLRACQQLVSEDLVGRPEERDRVRQQRRVGRICRRMPAPDRRQLGVDGFSHA